MLFWVLLKIKNYSQTFSHTYFRSKLKPTLHTNISICIFYGNHLKYLASFFAFYFFYVCTIIANAFYIIIQKYFMKIKIFFLSFFLFFFQLLNKIDLKYSYLRKWHAYLWIKRKKERSKKQWDIFVHHKAIKRE